MALALSAITVVGVVYAAGIRGRAPAPEMANVGTAGSAPVGSTAGPAPDISGMTPREQFIRLNDRIMTAAEGGDTTTVITFWPMAAGAYDNLSPAERDVDARYHMATLHLLVGRIPATMALADTIMAESPGNLMGWYLRAVVAEFEGDSVRATAARRAFRDGFDAEIAKSRPEYDEHAAQLRDYLARIAP